MVEVEKRGIIMIEYRTSENGVLGVAISKIMGVIWFMIVILTKEKQKKIIGSQTAKRKSVGLIGWQ